MSPSTWTSVSLIWPVRSRRRRLRKLRPSRLSVRPNQLTCEGDHRPGRPIERLGRFAASRIDDSISRQSSDRVGTHITKDAGEPICGHCSGRMALRVLGLSAIADAANGPTPVEYIDSARPFVPSSLLPKPRLRAQRIDALIHVTPDTKISSGHQIPCSPAIQDSDFPWEIALPFSTRENGALRASGALREKSDFLSSSRKFSLEK